MQGQEVGIMGQGINGIQKHNAKDTMNKYKESLNK